METKEKFLLKLSRHFSQEKFNSIFSYFNHPQPLYDHLQEDGATDDYDDDDWELIEVLDQEFAGEEEDGVDIELIDLDGLEASQSLHIKVKCRILSKDDVRRLLEEKVSQVSSVLLLSRSEAVVLLNHFKWRVNRVHDEWLTRQDKIRKVVGLFEKPVVEMSDSNEIVCCVCCESQKPDSMIAVSCGHQTCLACWNEYISTAINNGPECLTLRCPEQSCEAAVGIELIEFVSNEDEAKKVHDYLAQSFITSKSKAKWCPAQGCEYAVIAPVGEDFNNDAATCKCLHSFCWNCSEEAHAPIDCARVGDWLTQIVVQSDNWLLAKARPCPQCNKWIEETSCTLFSQCTFCNYMFSSDAFSGGASRNHDTTPCVDDENKSVKELAKSSLERFEQYYLRWSFSEAARANAVTDLKVLNEIRFEILCSYLSRSPEELDFLVEAQMQAITCWRILKWMNVYGYYLPEDEHLKTNLFEFTLEQAVKLVKMIEKQTEELINVVMASEISILQYMVHRKNIIQLNRVTAKYYDRLVDAMKADFSEVVSVSRRACSSPKTGDASSTSTGTSSPSTSPKRKVIKTNGEEGGDGNGSIVLDTRSEILIPSSGGSSSPRDVDEAVPVKEKDD